MKRLILAAALATIVPALQAAAEEPAAKEKITVTRVAELKDGGTITIDKDGHTYHVDASGKRARMKDNVVMEGKDGTKYLHKNDAIWQQIVTKGTMAPNR